MSHYVVADADGTKYCAFGLMKVELRPVYTEIRGNHGYLPLSGQMTTNIWIMLNGSADVIQNPATKIVMLPRGTTGSFWMKKADILRVVKDTQPDQLLTIVNAIAELETAIK